MKELRKEIDELYAALKINHNPYVAPELLPKSIISDQVIAAIIVFGEKIQKIHDRLDRLERGD